MSARLTRRGAGAVVAAAGLLAAGLAASPVAGAAARHAYPGSVPSFATTANDAGPAAADTTVEGEVFLPLRDPLGAQKLAASVSDPASAKYGKYISPSKWINTYSPTQQTFNQVKKYLVDSGYTIYATPQSRQFIVFRGPASAASAAFGTTIRQYHVDGRTVSAPSKAASLPTTVSKGVAGVVLGNARSQFTRPSNMVQPGSQRPFSSSQVTPKAAATQQCSDYWAQHTAKTPDAYGRTEFPTNICGYLPGQLRSSANLNKSINAGYNGSGQTVAILDAYASPTIVQDTNDYMSAVGSPLLTTYKQIKPAEFVDGDLCGGPAGWQGEQTLDVQSAHSIAPSANILYVGGFNCGGGLDIAMSKVLDGGLANIVSNSYGYTGEDLPDDLIAGQEASHIQAAAEGIGLYFSSGDNGDVAAETGSPQASYPASSPWVTAVGGTSLAVKADGTYQFETGWGTAADQYKDGKFVKPLPGDFAGGAGGGTSKQFAQPAYQKGVVPADVSTGIDGSPSRVVPDVGDLADPYTGFQIVLRPITNDAGTETGPVTALTYGGTSLASPMVAAKMALLQQFGGTKFGFANPAIYAASKNAASFRDVVPPKQTVRVAYQSATSGNTFLITMDRDTSLKTATGYDRVTGLGSLNVPGLQQVLFGS